MASVLTARGEEREGIHELGGVRMLSLVLAETIVANILQGAINPNGEQLMRHELDCLLVAPGMGARGQQRTCHNAR